MLDELLTSMHDSARSIRKEGQMFGIVTGTIKENWNQEHPGQVRVEYLLGETGKMVSNWADVLTPYAAAEGGFYFLPEVGTTVIVAFIGASPNQPLVIGSVWSKSLPLPSDVPKDKNPTKLIRTKGGTQILVSDEEGKESLSLTTKGGLNIVLSDEKKTVSFQDKEGKNSVVLDGEKGSLTLNADKEIRLSVGGSAAVTIKADKAEIKSGTLALSASQKFDVSGQTTNIKGSQMQIKADASMKMESSGIMEVKGSMVKVN